MCTELYQELKPLLSLEEIDIAHSRLLVTNIFVIATNPSSWRCREDEGVLNKLSSSLLEVAGRRTRRRGIDWLASLLGLICVWWRLQLEPTILRRVISCVRTGVPGCLVRIVWLLTVRRCWVASRLLICALLTACPHGRAMSWRWLSSEPSGASIRIETGFTATSGRET